MKYYYFHIWATDSFIKTENGKSWFYLDMFSKDTVFQAEGFWGLESLCTDFMNKKSLKIEIEKWHQIEFGCNALERLKESPELKPAFIYKLNFNGIAGKDDIGIYNTHHMVVSMHALELFRNAGVLLAEADLIDVPIDQYFDTSRNLFWMPEPFRSQFIERWVRKKSNKINP